MPEIRLELPPDLLGKLDTEVDLLGFADREAYLRWIIGNRAAIEQGTERDQLLTEYQARVDELEAQIEAHDGRGGDPAAGAADADASPADGASTTPSAATDGSGATTAERQRAEPGETQEPATESPSTPRVGETVQGEESATESTAGTTTTGDSPPQTAVDSEDASTARTPSDASDEGSESRQSTFADARTVESSSDPDQAVEAAAASSVRDLEVNFEPERVERFEDESLGSHADQLTGVEGERLDEFARRAVAKTRKRLGREPSTGLDYRSQTRIARSSSDVRPGEDLADLDTIDVPGRSEEAMAPRRAAVGAALAFLRDVRHAKRSDFVDELYAEHPAGYDSESSWWRCIKRGLKDAPVVEGGDGSRVWRYVPPGSREGELVGSGPKRVVDPE